MNSLSDLRAKGYRITRQREALLKQLRTKPQTAEQIFQSMTQKSFKIDLATVYRGLGFFLKHGLAIEADFGDGKKRYELLHEQKKHHHHFICKNCNSTEDISSRLEEKLIADFQSHSNFRLEDHSIELFGRCQNCI